MSLEKNTRIFVKSLLKLRRRKRSRWVGRRCLACLTTLSGRSRLKWLLANISARRSSCNLNLKKSRQNWRNWQKPRATCRSLHNKKCFNLKASLTAAAYKANWCLTKFLWSQSSWRSNSPKLISKTRLGFWSRTRRQRNGFWMISSNFRRFKW